MICSRVFSCCHTLQGLTADRENPVFSRSFKGTGPLPRLTAPGCTFRVSSLFSFYTCLFATPFCLVPPSHTTNRTGTFFRCRANYDFMQPFFKYFGKFEDRGPRDRNPRAKPEIGTLGKFRAACQALGFGPVFAHRRKSFTLQNFRNRLNR